MTLVIKTPFTKMLKTVALKMPDIPKYTAFYLEPIIPKQCFFIIPISFGITIVFITIGGSLYD